MSTPVDIPFRLSIEEIYDVYDTNREVISKSDLIYACEYIVGHQQHRLDALQNDWIPVDHDLPTIKPMDWDIDVPFISPAIAIACAIDVLLKCPSTIIEIYADGSGMRILDDDESSNATHVTILDARGIEITAAEFTVAFNHSPDKRMKYSLYGDIILLQRLGETTIQALRKYAKLLRV